MGASDAFIRCVATSVEGRNIAKEAVRRAEQLNSDAVTGGGFITALRDGDVSRARARADSQSQTLMDAAGVTA
jgi:hypothetical protein